MARFAEVLETSYADVPTEVLLGARRGEGGSEPPGHGHHVHHGHPTTQRGAGRPTSRWTARA